MAVGHCHPSGRQLLIAVALATVIGELFGCKSQRSPNRDVVLDFVRALDTSDADLYASCLDKDRYRYEGMLASSSTSNFSFSYSDDVAAMSASFKAGHVIDKNTAIASRSNNSAVVEFRARFINFHGSADESFGESYDIASKLVLDIGKDRFGAMRIQRVTETVPATGTSEILPSLGLVKFVNSNLYEEATQEVVETSLIDKRTGLPVLHMKTTQRWSSKNPVMENDFTLLDHDGHVISGVH